MFLRCFLKVEKNLRVCENITCALILIRCFILNKHMPSYLAKFPRETRSRQCLMMPWSLYNVSFLLLIYISTHETPKKSLTRAEIKTSKKREINLNFALRISVKMFPKCLKLIAKVDFDDGCFSRQYSYFNKGCPSKSVNCKLWMCKGWRVIAYFHL